MNELTLANWKEWFEEHWNKRQEEEIKSFLEMDDIQPAKGWIEQTIQTLLDLQKEEMKKECDQKIKESRLLDLEAKQKEHEHLNQELAFWKSKANK